MVTICNGMNAYRPDEADFEEAKTLQPSCEVRASKVCNRSISEHLSRDIDPESRFC